jgi:hypothetical protein
MRNDELKRVLHSSFRIHHSSFSIIADGFDGAGEQRLFAEGTLGVGPGLFVDEGVAAAVGAREVVG